jgi:hypothetical protein
MKPFKLLAILGVSLALGACSFTPSSDVGKGKSAGLSFKFGPEKTTLYPSVPANVSREAANWRVVDVRVTVPDELKVSERNLYYPVGDIVWREDLYGDRKKQVATILDDAMTLGLGHLKGPRAVHFDVTLRRFHALSEKARASVGGVHNIIYDLLVRDAKTGHVIYGPFGKEIELDAHGGQQAFNAVRKGLTQKLRISRHVSSEMRKSFSGNARLVLGASDQLAPQAQAFTARQ